MSDVQELIQALQHALVEIREHNSEYRWRTPDAMIVEWEALIERLRPKDA